MPQDQARSRRYEAEMEGKCVVKACVMMSLLVRETRLPLFEHRVQLQHKLTTLWFCAGLRHCWCSGGSGHEQNHSVQETMVIPKRSGCDPVVGLHFWSWQLLQF
jgi:hypothetical protein